MSQRYIRHPSGRYDALVGWDPPLRHHFLTILDTTVEHGEDDPVYSSITDPKAAVGGLPLPDIIATLEQWGFRVPPRLGEQLREDRQADRGNLVMRYQ